MKNLIIAFAVLALLTSVAWAGIDRIDRQVSSELEMKPTRSLTYFYDGADDGTPDPWITVDNTMTPQPIRWHVTTHLVAYGTYAYFCGIEPPAPELTGDLNGDGGYGNDWDQWLDLPPVAGITAAGYPMISYSHRFDMELGFDYCVVEAQILGVYTDMMGAGFEHTGVSGPGPDPTWQTMVAIGWNLTGADDPLIARFRMRSDPGWSDADGKYDSNCGAIHVDDIRVWDYYGIVGTLFQDDVEDGIGQCSYSVPIPTSGAGDFWHIITQLCHADSDPNLWWCGDDGDTSGYLGVVAGIDNSLFTPVIDISGALTCSMYFMEKVFFPFVDPQPAYGWKEIVWFDGLGYELGYWGGDLVSDYGAPTACYYAFHPDDDWTYMLPASTFQYEWRVIGDPVVGIPGFPGVDRSSLYVDDVWVRGLDVTSVEESSWGNIKAMYR